MKKVLMTMMFLFAAMLAPMAQAEPTETPAAKQGANSWQAKCQKISELAEQVMITRQSGVSISKMMEVAADNKGLQEMVIEAYEQSQYSTPTVKAKVVSEFRDRWYMMCVKTLRK